MGKKKQRFVSQTEAEALAKKHIEAYVAECHCQSVDDVKLATQKMLAMAYSAFDAAHHGTAAPLQ